MKLLITLLLISAAPMLLMAKTANPDELFFKGLAAGGLAEIEAGRLAQERGSTQAVKDFGAMMVRDHSAANARLRALAASKNIDLGESSPVAPSVPKEESGMMSGASFDRAYIQDQIRAHESTVELLNREITTGEDAEAKALASEILPKVEEHLNKIRQMATDMRIEQR